MSERLTKARLAAVEDTAELAVLLGLEVKRLQALILSEYQDNIRTHDDGHRWLDGCGGCLCGPTKEMEAEVLALEAEAIRAEKP